jgi:hypothetical protein
MICWLGVEIVGHREKIGRTTHGPLTGRWGGTLPLERRSPRGGVD